MARIVDESKMMRVKKVATQLIVHNGYGGASISSIAQEAGVADGYLYRFYPSKLDLVNELLYLKIHALIQKMDESIDTCSTISKMIEVLFQEFFTMADENPDDLKFLYVLMHDYNFQVSAEQRALIKALCQKFLSVGILKGEIIKHTGLEEIYNMLIAYPIEFLNLRLKNFFSRNTWDREDLKRLTLFCANALK